MPGIGDGIRGPRPPTTPTAAPTTAPTTPARPTTPAGPAVWGRPAAAGDAFVTGTSTVGTARTGDAVAGEPKTYVLKDPTLAKVAEGSLELAKGAKGEPVKKMQEALELAGYKLARYGADGDFGNETVGALKRFQTASGINPPSGRLDKATLEKLDAAAVKGLKFPEYGKLFADGKLDATIAVGYDEDGWHRIETNTVVAGLVGDGTAANPGQGYTELDVKTATDDALRDAGLEPDKTDKEARYFVKTFQHDGKDVKAVVKLITPDMENAKEKFAKAMSESELVMYAGHGRYGSGPDFDDIRSTAGNFVIGDPFEAGHVTLGENDLRKTKMTKDYQMMMFSGCNTFRYLDDLRGVPGKDSKNLDLMVSTHELYWDKMGTNALEMLGGVTTGKSSNEIKSNLETVNRQAGIKSVWKGDGFGDN